MIFRHAENVMGCSGDRILFVGNDLKKDVAGATGVGWSTAYRVPPECTPPGVANFEFFETRELLPYILES